jgi:hypothetical protein
MAAAPRLTPEEWAKVRETWENDPRDGFEWLIRELGLPVSPQAVRKRSRSPEQPWIKALPKGAVRRVRASAENTRKAPAKPERQSSGDLKGRGSVVGESEGGEQSPPKGFRKGVVSKRKKPAGAGVVIDMATGEMGADEGSDGSANHGSDGSSGHGSDGSYRHKWKMNLGSGEELWRNTVPMVPPRDEESGPGRKSTYQKLFAHQAFMFCLKGATNDTLADLFQVSARTISRWLNEHKEFCHAVMAGRQRADAQVAMSLYQRAIGMVIPKAHVSAYKGEVTITEIQEYLPPDVGAASLWLFNRDPENWRSNPELPPPPPGSDMPFDAEMDALYAQSMEASKTRAEAARLDRQRHGLFGKRPELDNLEEEPVLIPSDGEDY